MSPCPIARIPASLTTPSEISVSIASGSTSTVSGRNSKIPGRSALTRIRPAGARAMTSVDNAIRSLPLSARPNTSPPLTRTDAGIITAGSTTMSAPSTLASPRTSRLAAPAMRMPSVDSGFNPNISRPCGHPGWPPSRNSNSANVYLYRSLISYLHQAVPQQTHPGRPRLPWQHSQRPCPHFRQPRRAPGRQNWPPR